MLNAPGDRRHECFFEVYVKVFVGSHVVEPSVFDYCGVDLPDARCKGNGAVVGWVCGILCCTGLWEEFDGSLFSCI